MTKIERVIDSLGRCTCHVPDACRDCAYDDKPTPECWLTLERDALELLKEQEAQGWISVKDRMPEERPSIFASCYGTKKWANGMWRNESDRVLVTILFPDGTRTVDKGKLQDGTWKTGVSPVLPQVVTHWAMWPEPPKEEENG